MHPVTTEQHRRRAAFRFALWAATHLKSLEKPTLNELASYINFLNEENYFISAFVVSNANCIEAQAPQCLAFRAHDDGAMRHEYTGGWCGMIRPRLPWFSERLA